MTRPNIIFLVLDAARAEDLSCYGYERETTPYLSEFVVNNLLFKRAFAPATWTVPTHASMLSGLYLSQHRLENVKANRSFNQEIVTLPRALQANHYKTAAFSQNFLFSNAHHLTDEFDEFFPLWDVERRQIMAAGNQHQKNHSNRYWKAIQRYGAKKGSLRPAFNSMYHWLTAVEMDSPVFLMANITNAHYPWAPPFNTLWRWLGKDIRYMTDLNIVTPNPFRFNSGRVMIGDRHRQVWRALYDAAIAHIDRELARFIKLLQKWSGWTNTILIITADHGEILGDYRNIFGHTLSLSERLMHVPLIIKHPDYQFGLTIEGVVQNLDLFHSILEWTGSLSDHIPAAQLQRPSLTEAVANSRSLAGFAFAEEDYSDSYNPIAGLMKTNPKMDPDKYPPIQRAVRSATHKYIWRGEQGDEYYDLVADPAEAKNLIDTTVEQEIGILHELQDALSLWYAEMEVFPPQVEEYSAELAPQMTAQLRALGYIV